MNKAAFTIYILSLYLAVSVVFLSIFNFAMLMLVMLFIFSIAAFVCKKKCKEERLMKHFTYQFKTLLIVFIYLFILALGTGIVIYFGKTIDNLFDKELVMLVGYVSLYLTIIASFIFYIWFVYRNIKGLVYLNKNKNL
ncbi:MAG: hypothetical protein LBP40_05655 [Campylobacteraceae bacterium]|jgi:uncharacterized membrane protein|nr:hypothetical protein [Campylobacteraceae bacterium]